MVKSLATDVFEKVFSHHTPVSSSFIVPLEWTFGSNIRQFSWWFSSHKLIVMSGVLCPWLFTTWRFTLTKCQLVSVSWHFYFSSQFSLQYSWPLSVCLEQNYVLLFVLLLQWAGLKYLNFLQCTHSQWRREKKSLM